MNGARLKKKGKIMKVRVTIKEIKTTYKTYEVDGVNSLETAAKCAERAYLHQFQPNAYLYHDVPCPKTHKIDKYEVVDES